MLPRLGKISFCLKALLLATTSGLLPHTMGALSVVPVSVSACTACDGSVSLTTGLSGNCFYMLKDAEGDNVASDFTAVGNLSFSGLCSGFYTAEVSNGIETETAYFNLSSALTNPGSASAESVCSSGAPFDLSSALAGYVPGGSWTDPEGALLPGPVITAASAMDGVYEYGVSEGGCTVTSGVAITVIESPNPGLSTTYLICETYTPFNLIDHLAGDPDSGGQWFAPGAVAMNGVFDPAVMNSTLFTYMIAGNNGCPAVFSTMMVLENLLPDAGEDNAILLCTDADPLPMIGQLAGSPAAGGNWYDASDNPFPANFDPAWMPAGTYRYHVSGTTPCPGTDAYLTIALAQANPSGENTVVNFCETHPPVDAFGLLNGSPVPGGLWTGEDGLAADPLLTPAGGPVTLYYTYPSVGCAQDMAALTMQVEATPYAGDGGSAVLCESAGSFDFSTLLTAGVAGGGLWTDDDGNVASPIFNLTGAGNVTLQYTLAGIHCPDASALCTLVVEPSPPSPGAIEVAVCAGLAFNLDSLAGTGGMSAAWSDPLGPVSPIGVAAETMSYSAVISSGNTCAPGSTEVTVVAEYPPFVSGDLVGSVCVGGQPVDLTSFAPGIDFTSGTWTSAGTAVGPWVDENALPATFLFTDTVTTACPPAQFSLSLLPVSPASAGPDLTETLCENAAPFGLSTLLDNATSTSGTWWREGTALGSDWFDPAASPAGPYLYILPSEGPCLPDSAWLNLQVIALPAAEAGADLELCAGTATANLGSAPSENLSYTWVPATWLSNAAISNPTLSIDSEVSSSLQLEYTLTVTGEFCVSTDTVAITIRPLPAAGLSGTTELCEGEPAYFTSSGGTPVYWWPTYFFPDPTLSAQTAWLQESCVVGVTVRNEWNCERSDSIAVSMNATPEALFMVEGESGCAPVTLQAYNLSQNGPDVSYYWQVNGSSAPVNDAEILTFDQPGAYWIALVAQSAAGCTQVASEAGPIEVHPLPTAQFFITPEDPGVIYPEVDIFNESTGAIQFIWGIDGTAVSLEEEPELVFAPEHERTYTICLEAISEEGCADTLCRNLFFEETAQVFVPNAFTPDQDGINDVFLPVLTGFDGQTYEMRVFDRWGSLVFETRDTGLGWTGNVRGGSYYAEDGLYQWVISIRKQFGAEMSRFQGHVTLLR